MRAQSRTKVPCSIATYALFIERRLFAAGFRDRFTPTVAPNRPALRTEIARLPPFASRRVAPWQERSAALHLW